MLHSLSSLAQSELTESILVPLVSQFGLMQQQMFDQFQQAMAMMVQMFGTMHRDQMEVIRAELDQLRELTEEFHALKSELAERTREQAERPMHEPEVNSTGADRQAAMGSSVSATPPPPPTAPVGQKVHPGVSRGGQTARIHLRYRHSRQWGSDRHQNPIFYQPNLRQVCLGQPLFLNQFNSLVPARLPSSAIQAQRLIKTETLSSGSISES